MEALRNIMISHRIRDIVFPYRGHIQTLSVLIFANGIAAAASWLTQIYVANTLGRELFGQVAFAIAIGIFGQVFVRIGLDRTLVRDLVHYPERLSEIVRASLYLRCLLALVVLCGLLLWKVLNQDSPIGWGIVLIAMGLSILSLDLQPVYDVWQKTTRHTIYYLFHRACYLSLIWAALLFFQSHLSSLWIGIATLISAFFYLVLQHRWAFQRMENEPKKHFAELRGSMKWLMQNNALVWLSAILSLIIAMLNQPLLQKIAGFSELGVYAAAWQIVAIGMLLIDQISRIGRPATAHITKPGVPPGQQIRFLLRYAVIMAGGVMPLVALMVITPETVITLFFKPEYHAATTILPILGVYVLLLAIGMVLSQFMLSARLERAYIVSVLIGGILSIALSPFLIIKLGIVGAALVPLISHGAVFAFYCLSTIRHVRKSPSYGAYMPR